MSEIQNGSFRRKVNFAAVSNNALKDIRLSLKAKGLYALIQSYITLPGKRLSKSFLQSRCKEREKAFDSAWKELKDAGYLKQYRAPSGENDKFVYEYELLDESNETQPALTTLNKRGEKVTPKQRDSHIPQNGGNADEPASYDGHSQPPQNVIHTNPHTPHFVPYANGTSCERHIVPNGGGISNTLDYKIKESKIPDYNNLSVYHLERDDRRTDEIKKKLLEQIDLDWIQETHPNDIHAADTLINCMVDMISAPFTIIGGIRQSRYALEKRMADVDEEDVVGFLDHMRGTPIKDIKNIKAYWKSSFINYLSEQDFAVDTI